MKELVRILTRYIGAAVCIGLLLVTLNIAALVSFIVSQLDTPALEYKVRAFSEGLTQTADGWTLPDGVDLTDDTHTKFTMPDTNVTVTGTWTFTPTTFVYVYFRTVDSAGNDIDNVEGVTYNDDKTDLPRHWATLGKLETKTSVTDNVYEALGNEVVAQTGFEYYNTANNSFPLDLIT